MTSVVYRRIVAIVLWIGGFLRNLLCIAVAATLLLIVYLTTFGAPDWMLARINSLLNRGPIYIETPHMWLRLPFGICVNDARLFWKGRVGPPAAEARRLTINIDPRAFWKDVPPIRSIAIRDGIFRPEMIPPSPAAPGARPAAPVDFRLFIALRDCILWNQHVASMRFLLVSEGGTVAMKDIQAVLREGSLTGRFAGTVSYEGDTRKVVGHLDCLADPHILLPLMDAARLSFLAGLTQRFEFQDAPPHAIVDFQTRTSPNAPLDVVVDFSTARLAYQGVPCVSAKGRVDVHSSTTGSVVKVSPLTVIREEGRGDGGFSVVDDNGHSYVTFDATSSIAFPALTGMIGIMTNGFWDTCRTGGPYAGWARGRVTYPELAGSDFRGQLRFGAFGADKLTISNCVCDMGMVGPTVIVRNVSGTLCEGTVTGLVDVVLPSGGVSDTFYRATGVASDVDFPTIVTKLGKRPDPNHAGALTLSFDMAGPAGTNLLRAAQGRGSVRLSHGRVFMLPLFGGLSKMMTRIIPGLDFVLRQTDLSAQFDLAGGKLTSRKVLIEGDVLSLRGSGSCDLDGTLAFDAQLQFMKEHTLVAKLFRPVLYPITKLFELRLTGTLDDPQWRAINFSSDLLDRLGHATHLTDSKARDDAFTPAAPPGNAPSSE
jgi:hypothetical protein